MKYYAHYDKKKSEKQLLNTHLDAVANLAYKQVPTTIKFDDISSSLIQESIYWMGRFHDIGKYSNYFQDYLINNVNSKLKNHAHISACYTYNFLLDRYHKGNVDEKTYKIFIFLCYISVRLHHTSLRMDGLFQDGVWNDLESLEKHLINKGESIFKDINLGDSINLEQFLKYFDIKSLKKNKLWFEYIPLMFNNGRISDPKWYFLLIYVFSLIIDIDKLDSAYIKPQKVRRVPPNNVTKYINSKGIGEYKSDLISDREKVRNTMINVVDSLSDGDIKVDKFFTLTAPTGIGKTLSSLQCVLRLQERIEQVEGYTPRIITAIPFINIIEQNKEEYENVFSNQIKVVVHHRLSDFSSKQELDKEIPVEKELLEVESWEGDVILTTFVQFFHTIFTGDNKPLKKLNKLAGSIVILDEAQAIPEDYMPVVGASLQMISKYYGTRFVLMTATQPKLLEFGDMLLSKNNIAIENIKRVELLPNNKKYFKKLQRTKFVPMLNKRINTQEFIDIFFEKWECDKSGLIVVNTIKRSIEIYTELKEQLKKREMNIPVYYLSTNIIPKRRGKVIKKVKNILDDKKPVILVSTQTIEAGVDLDFDMGFRDFAPLDSLIQTAGRVNREGKKGVNIPVYIFQLENDNNYIYNLSHRISTLELLKEKPEIYEKEYCELAEKYYTSALDREISDKSRDIWNEGIMKLDFEALKKFKLIENISEIVDVFVEYDEKATDLADAYEELLRYNGDFNYDLTKALGDSYSNIKGELDVFKRKALLRLVMTKMNDYIIQIRINRLIENRPIEFSARGDVESSLYWIPFDQKSRYYNEGTGFIDKNGEGFIY